MLEKPLQGAHEGRTIGNDGFASAAFLRVASGVIELLVCRNCFIGPLGPVWSFVLAN